MLPYTMANVHNALSFPRNIASSSKRDISVATCSISSYTAQNAITARKPLPFDIAITLEKVGESFLNAIPAAFISNVLCELRRSHRKCNRRRSRTRVAQASVALLLAAVALADRQSRHTVPNSLQISFHYQHQQPLHVLRDIPCCAAASTPVCNASILKICSSKASRRSL